MGTVRGSDAAIKLLDVVRATLRTTFRSRFELRVPRFFFFDVGFVTKSSADYAERGGFGKAKFAISGEHRPLAAASLSFPAACRKHAHKSYLRPAVGISASCRDEQAGSAGSLRSPSEPNALRAAHVGAGAGVDFDRFAFLDEKRHVNGLSGFELCRLGDVTGSVAAQTFR